MEWYIWLIIIGFSYFMLRGLKEKNQKMFDKGGETWSKIKDWINR